MKEQQEEPRMLSLIDGWLGPKCLNRFDVQKSICQYCPARLICSDRKQRGVAPLGADTLWVAIPNYEGIIEEIGVFDSKEKAVAWLKEVTEGDLDDEDRVCDGDWAGSSIEEVEVK